MEANMLAMKLLEETGPNTELSWLLYVVLGFFLLMVLVGWWVSSRKAEQVEVAHEAPSLHPESHEEKVLPDDLVRLEGIGPKVAKVLNDAGITTFAALAHANPAEVQKSLSAAGMQMMNPAGWIEQAALAEKGDWESLQKLQGELRGGRRK
jgi:hypothetical protein